MGLETVKNIKAALGRALQSAKESITISNGTVTSGVLPVNHATGGTRLTYNNKTGRSCTVQVEHSPNYKSDGDANAVWFSLGTPLTLAAAAKDFDVVEKPTEALRVKVTSDGTDAQTFDIYANSHVEGES